MRWADLDLLNHVNNVVYADYAMEAYAALVDHGDVAPGPIARATVEFRRPLLLSREPVVVESTVDGPTVRQEIRSGESATVFASVELVHGEVEPATPHDTRDDEPYALRVRRSDLGPDGAATLVTLFEYSQEARIHRISGALRGLTPGRFVVGRVTVHPGEPLTWRPDAYPVHTDVTRVGGSSMTLSSVIDGGRHGSAEAVLVGFDTDAQTSRRLDEDERADLLEQCVAG